ncbi:hypothetical protein [Sorangium sp. So ce1024]|uniref:hypothetical protein n=1 Tax=Sorangium sp. So ce1024 TaxID=3133327 RepID=UPI003F06C7AD
MDPNHRAPQGNTSADRRPATTEDRRPQAADQRPQAADRRPPDEEQPEGFAWKGALAVALVVGGLVVWRACSPSDDAASSAPAPSAALAPGDPGDPAATAQPPRCAPAGAAPFVIGDAPPAPATAAQDAGPEQGAGGAGADIADDLAPFAVEVGRGATFGGGFAVGAQRDAEGGTVAMVATLSADGAQGKLVRLARSRGDMDPPVVTGAGGAILAAMLEPNAGGRAIKIARIEGEHVTWGAELAEGRDESLALDIAASGERAVIVWDDVTRDGKRSQIMLASADVGSLRSVTSPRPVSQPSTDAETPRVIARPGGYWLAYIARADEPARRAPVKEGEELNEDTAAAGETIAHQWLEVAPLDQTGALTATPRAVTPKNGHVLAYDLTLGEDGGVLLAFRDDDTPSGSIGGRISAVLVRLGGVSEPRVLVGGDRAEDTPPEAALGVGAGVPALLRGAAGPGAQGSGSAADAAVWLAIANASGPTQLAALTARGELQDGLYAEPALGRGEPIAASADALLVAHPAGKAMKLEVLRCASAPPGK